MRLIYVAALIYVAVTFARPALGRSSPELNVGRGARASDGSSRDGSKNTGRVGGARPSERQRGCARHQASAIDL